MPIRYIFYCILFVPACALALPLDHEVVSGTATFREITPSSLEVTVSDKAILNYPQFHIDAHESVTFHQPNAKSCVLNRVTGKDPSAILGRLQSNGKVFLVNPQGIYFGPSAQVNVGSLIASTLDIRDQDFLEERYHFFVQPGTEHSQILQEGILAVSLEGIAALLAPHITNTGIICAQAGKILLGSGEKITLDFTGNGLLHFAVEEPALEGSITQAGVLQNPQGGVFLHLATVQQVLKQIINMEGISVGEEIVEEQGVIKILAQNTIHARNIHIEGPTVEVSGSLDASHSEGKGGEITLLGDHLTLSQAHLNASGHLGGGTVSIGEGALTTRMDSSSQIYADAWEEGSGGNVVLWAQEKTQFCGQIFARGGKTGGNGGFIETSGKGLLHVTGAVNALAPQGAVGKWLIDPDNIIIDPAGLDPLASAICGAMPGSTVTISPATINAALVDVILCAEISITQNAGANIAMVNPGIGITFEGNGATIITTLNGSVSTTGGDIQFLNTNPVFVNNLSLAGNTSVTSGGGNILFFGAIDDAMAGTHTLTIDAGGGVVSVGGSGGIGSTTALDALTITGGSVSILGIGTSLTPGVVNATNVTSTAGDIVLSPSVPANYHTTGSQSYFPSADLSIFFGTIITTHDNPITVSGTVNSLPHGSLAITSGNAPISISGALGATSDLHGVALSGSSVSMNDVGTALTPGITTTDLTITTSGGPITLNGTIYNVDFGQVYTVAAGQDLLFNAGASTTVFSRDITVTTSGGGTTLLSSGTNLTLDSTSDGVGHPIITGDIHAAAGDLRTLTVNAGLGEANITLATVGTIGNGEFSSVQITGADFTLGTVVADSISTTLGPANTLFISGGLFTTGTDLILNSPVQLTGPTVTFSTQTTTGSLTFNGLIDGDAPGRALTVQAGTASGTVAFNSPVGNTTPVGDLTVVATNDFSAGDITADSITQQSGTGQTQNSGTWTTNVGGISLTSNVILLGGVMNSSTTLAMNAGTNIFNVTIPVSLSSANAATFNAQTGNVGTNTSPIEINTPSTIVAGAASSAFFQGTPFHDYLAPAPAVVDFPGNPACIIFFNFIEIKNCTSIVTPPVTPNTLPPNVLYVPGTYSAQGSLIGNYYFLGNWVNSSYALSSSSGLLNYPSSPHAPVPKKKRKGSKHCNDGGEIVQL